MLVGACQSFVFFGQVAGFRAFIRASFITMCDQMRAKFGYLENL